MFHLAAESVAEEDTWSWEAVSAALELLMADAGSAPAFAKLCIAKAKQSWDASKRTTGGKGYHVC